MMLNYCPLNDKRICLNVHKLSEHMYIIYVWAHYEKKLTKNIRPTDILQLYTSI